MKRKWVLTINKTGDDFWDILFPMVYVCKICGHRRIKKREIIFHISTMHSKWEKRGDSWGRESFAFYYIDKKPETNAILIGGLFQ